MMSDELFQSNAPALNVSPHYDDAVFSCGNFLAGRPGSTVITVFGGVPSDAELLTDWDRRCGFDRSCHAMRERTMENRRALFALHAKALEFDFLDSQYTGEADIDDVQLVDTLFRVVAQLQSDNVFMPLGLFHGDHIRLSDALMAICGFFPDIQWFAYEDIPYRKQVGLVQERLSLLYIQGVSMSPVNLQCPATRQKAAAVSAYRSQLVGLGPGSKPSILRQSEHFWHLSCSVGRRS